MDLHDLNIR